jgi:hypothetical protein
MGLISKSKKKKVWNIGWELLTSTLYLDGDCSAQIGSGGNYSDFFNGNNEFELINNSTIDIEVNCEKKTIYYFINKKQCPYYISDISSSSFPLLFGFSAYRSPIIEIISLFKILPSFSYVNPPVECKPLKWVLFVYFI